MNNPPDTCRFSGGRGRHSGFDVDEEVHYPTRPVDKDKAEQELVVNIKKATSPDESAPKQKHVRSELAGPSLLSLTLNIKQNVSFTPGTTTRLYLSGVAFESNRSLLMRFKPSRL